jgi:hypothetical protein
MVVEDYSVTVLWEHRFWLQILGDHSRFIYHSLSPTEIEGIQYAHILINEFDQLLTESRKSLSTEEIAKLNHRTAQSVEKLKSFKLQLLRRQLVGKVNLNMSPTFINHMINELEEYESILKHFLLGYLPPKAHPVHHHLLWQSDAIGHAASFVGSLDMEEKSLIQKSQSFQKDFENQYRKVQEFAGYLRTNLETFPALTRFNLEAERHMEKFMDFLREIDKLLFENALLGTINPLLPDHMLREECYYLMKLAQVSTTPSPSCDPTKARKIEN